MNAKTGTTEFIKFVDNVKKIKLMTVKLRHALLVGKMKYTLQLIILASVSLDII